MCETFSILLVRVKCLVLASFPFQIQSIWFHFNFTQLPELYLSLMYTLTPMPSLHKSPSLPQISLIIACIIGVIAYRLAVYAAFASIMKDSPTNNIHMVGSLITPQLATSVTASCINFVIIMILNVMYERVAIWITDMGKIESSRLDHW